MGIVRDRAKLKRTQISLSDEELQTLRRMASQRRMSMSKLIRQAIRREIEARWVDEEALLSIIGLGDDIGDRDGSVTVDDVVYG